MGAVQTATALRGRAQAFDVGRGEAGEVGDALRDVAHDGVVRVEHAGEGGAGGGGALLEQSGAVGGGGVHDGGGGHTGEGRAEQALGLAEDVGDFGVVEEVEKHVDGRIFRD